MGGNFSFKRLADPLGLTIGKGSKGSALDPLNLFGKSGDAAGAGADAGRGPAVPLPVPPPNSNSAAVVQAQHDLAAQNLLKKSVKKTIIAGDTGGYRAPGGGPSPSAFGGP